MRVVSVTVSLTPAAQRGSGMVRPAEITCERYLGTYLIDDWNAGPDE